MTRESDYTAESHECHGKDTCGDESYRSALHCFGYIVAAQLLTQTCKEYKCYSEAKGGSQSEERTGEQVVVKTFGEFVRAVSHEDSNTEDAAVRGDKRKEHTESLIQRRRDLLEDDLNHLHERGDDEDEQDRLQEAESEGIKQHLQQVRYDGCEHKDESHGCTHTKGSVDLLADAQERTYTEELTQYDIVNKYRRYEY